LPQSVQRNLRNFSPLNFLRLASWVVIGCFRF
jgi:hypothetical protein